MDFYSLYAVILLIVFLISKRVAGKVKFQYRTNDQKYFINFESEYTWFDSQFACSSMNMTLVEVDTSEKSTKLKNLLETIEINNAFESGHLWIGGIRIQYPFEDFVWFSSGKKFNFTDWDEDTPDFDGENEYCIEYFMPYNNKRWNDANCYLKRGYICERKEILPGSKNCEENQHNVQDEMKKIQFLQSAQQAQTKLLQEENRLQEKQFENHLKEEMININNLQNELKTQKEKQQVLQETLEVEANLLEQLRKELELLGRIVRKNVKIERELEENQLKIVNALRDKNLKNLEKHTELLTTSLPPQSTNHFQEFFKPKTDTDVDTNEDQRRRLSAHSPNYFYFYNY